MFQPAYFGNRYWNPRYWMNGGSTPPTPPVPGGTTLFTNRSASLVRNRAGQTVGAEVLTTAGAAFTGAVSVYVTGDGGTQALGGLATLEGHGYYTYVPSQAETNYVQVAFTFVGSGAMPISVPIYTVTR